MCLQFLQSGAETGVLGQAGLCDKTLQTRKQTTGKALVNLVNPGVFIVTATGFPKVHECSVMSMWRTWSKFSHSTFMWVPSIKLGLHACTASTLNCWGISPALFFCFLMVDILAYKIK